MYFFELALQSGLSVYSSWDKIETQIPNDAFPRTSTTSWDTRCQSFLFCFVFSCASRSDVATKQIFRHDSRFLYKPRTRLTVWCLCMAAWPFIYHSRIKSRECHVPWPPHKTSNRKRKQNSLDKQASLSSLWAQETKYCATYWNDRSLNQTKINRLGCYSQALYCSRLCSSLLFCQ